jgi:dolichol-phosphate mannosyltransferase
LGLHDLPPGSILPLMSSLENEHSSPNHVHSPRLLVTLCTFNERENLAELIPEIRLLVPAADILVIDDNSPDGTSELVLQMGKADSQVQVLTRAGKLGLGSAIREGLRQGCDRGYDFVLTMDADFSHPTRFIPDLIAAMDEADVVIGSRYVKGGKIVGWSRARKVMSRLINVYVRLLLGLRNRDNSGNFRCYRASKLKLIPWEKSVAKGYAFLEELLFRCKLAGCRFAEVPITFEERRHGSSKINWREAVGAVWTLFRVRVQSIVTSLRSSAP